MKIVFESLWKVIKCALEILKEMNLIWISYTQILENDYLVSA